jgi:anti-sigma B factor antagonist
MDLTVQVVQRDGWAVVLVGGDIDLTTAPSLREQLLRLGGEGQHHLVVDLTGVGFCDSTGLGVLVGAAKRARTAEGDVVLCGLSPSLERVFSLTGLDQAFVIHPSLDVVPARDG